MSKEENVIKYYTLCNKLKNVIRTGWLDWNVKRERLESVAEHIYGVQMLAIAIKSEYNYDIDIMKVIYMLALHELEEIIIGDLTHFQISKDEKNIIGKNAVNEILKNIEDKDEIEKIIDEFNERKTKEAIFAHYCDKLECDLQCKLYDEEKCVDLNDQKGNTTLNNKEVIDILKKEKTWSSMWLHYSRNKYNYDEAFNNISLYAQKNKMSN